MIARMPLFAQAVDNLSPRPLGTGTKLVMGDIFWGLLGALAFAVILFVWARYSRRSKRRENRDHRPTIVQNSIRSMGRDEQDHAVSDDDGGDGHDPEGAESDVGSSSSKHRKRRKRRGHRPRNPTLEETGGLPPSRGNDPGSLMG